MERSLSMDARVLLTPEEYLRAQFDGPDRDYVDGEVIERNPGELPHAILQAESARHNPGRPGRGRVARRHHGS